MMIAGEVKKRRLFRFHHPDAVRQEDCRHGRHRRCGSGDGDEREPGHLELRRSVACRVRRRLRCGSAGCRESGNPDVPHRPRWPRWMPFSASRAARAAAEESRPASLESALKILPGANLALISVAGRFAGNQAKRALESGLNVMLFSDNVALQTEIELKKLARERGLLMMGPDCGTAIINGVPLAFANVVRRGDIGIVAASGTGMQEASCIISNAGGGISQAIGTGSRDVEREVGGTMLIEALKALAEDETHQGDSADFQASSPGGAGASRRRRQKIGKPVIDLFVGAGRPGGPSTLEEAALMAVGGIPWPGSSPGFRRTCSARDDEIRQRAGREAARRRNRPEVSARTFQRRNLLRRSAERFSPTPLPMSTRTYRSAGAAKLKNSLRKPEKYRCRFWRR